MKQFLTITLVLFSIIAQAQEIQVYDVVQTSQLQGNGQFGEYEDFRGFFIIDREKSKAALVSWMGAITTYNLFDTYTGRDEYGDKYRRYEAVDNSGDILFIDFTTKVYDESDEEYMEIYISYDNGETAVFVGEGGEL